MKQANFTELRNNAKQYFDIVEAGESVRVIRNGKTIADIVPVLDNVPSLASPHLFRIGKKALPILPCP